jgi:hypothetical protein
MALILGHGVLTHLTLKLLMGGHVVREVLEANPSRPPGLSLKSVLAEPAPRCVSGASVPELHHLDAAPAPTLLIVRQNF